MDSSRRPRHPAGPSQVRILAVPPHVRHLGPSTRPPATLRRTKATDKAAVQNRQSWLSSVLDCNVNRTCSTHDEQGWENTREKGGRRMEGGGGGGGWKGERGGGKSNRTKTKTARTVAEDVRVNVFLPSPLPSPSPLHPPPPSRPMPPSLTPAPFLLLLLLRLYVSISPSLLHVFR